MSLTSEEREALAADFRRELEDDREQRLEKLADRERRRDQRRDRDRATQRQIAMNELKEKVRADFYKEHGYRQYVDSTGREVWLTPEEYAVRLKRRKARNRKAPSPLNTQRRIWLAYAGVAVLAVILGLALAS